MCKPCGRSGWEVLLVKVRRSCLHHMKPPFHGWLTWWKVIGGPGKWSDMANNFHYVSVTLSHLLINFPVAVHTPPWGLERKIPSNLFSLALVQLWWNCLETGDKQIMLILRSLVRFAGGDQYICLLLQSQICLSLPQLLFIDHCLLPDAICLSFSLPHTVTVTWEMFPFVSSAFLSLAILCRMWEVYPPIIDLNPYLASQYG